jgi:hypothetical protein
VKRISEDYERLRCCVRLFDPDIPTVQEVDGEEALSRVVDTDVYDVYVDDRPKGSLSGQQNIGFAFRRGLTVVRRPDLTALTQDMPINCRDNRFTEFIDHIVVDPWVRPWVDRSSFRQVAYR